MRKADLPVPFVPSESGACFRCRAPVWLSPATDAALRSRPGSAVICQVCTYDDLARKDPDEPVEVRLLPGTVEEVARWREAQR
jgi:hypothetical protein